MADPPRMTLSATVLDAPVAGKEMAQP
jgi:hypothetical protein